MDNRNRIDHRELQELLRRQTVLTRFGELALRSDSLDEILTEACHLVGEALGTDLAKVVELQQDGQTLLVRAGVGWKHGVVGQTTIQMTEETSEAYVLKTHEPMTSPDIAAETRFKYPPFLTDNGVRAVANVIIISGNDRLPYGILQVDSRTPRQFTEADLGFLQNYANFLAAAVDRLRSLGEAREGEARLRDSESRLERAISAAGMSTWEWDTVSDGLQFSPGFEALHGQEVGALPSLRALQRAVCPEDWPAVDVALNRALRGDGQGKLAVEFRVFLPDDTVRWLRATGNAKLDDKGAPTRVAGVTQDITTSRNAEDRIAHMAMHDSLTGLLNRHTLQTRLEDALLRSKRGESCAILALDLDGFKDVNDTLGHAVGDAVLCSVASRLLEATRKTDIVARPGGDEFIIIQFSLNQPLDIEVLATRIVTRLSQPHQIDGHRITTGVSVGIAVAPADGTEVEQVLRNADLALYDAKTDDETHFRFFEPWMQAHARERRRFVDDLRQALAMEQFELHYQPLVELASDKVIGFEALVRWRHPVRGLMLPDKFIPLAEETGLIEPLGEWILNKACADAAMWPSEMKVAVNLSSVQFSRGDLVGTVAAALKQAGLTADRLELEITERLLLLESEATSVILSRLRDYGASISMDDFGIGYSSLSYISKFSFDNVKIDRSFVTASVEEKNGAEIIRAVAELCRRLGITTTAEGIETVEHLQRVMALGCTHGQGYLFSRPCPLEAIPALLKSWSESDRSIR